MHWASQRPGFRERYDDDLLSFKDKLLHQAWDDAEGTPAYYLKVEERKHLVKYCFLFAKLIESVGATFDLGQDNLYKVHAVQVHVHQWIT
jgi:hypothetical protein